MDNTIRGAQILGVTSSLLLAGANIGSSILTMPLLYTRPTSISTPFFSEFYSRGAVTLVPLSIFSATCSGLVAYLLPAQRNQWAMAGMTTISQLPWTLLVMMATNKRLIAVSESQVLQEKAGREEVLGLLVYWARMNILRGSLALVGGLIGMWAMVAGPQ